MKFTLSWLKEHLDTQATLDDIVSALTRIGLEVESVDNPAAKLAVFKIAHVIEAVPHPNADKLRVCKVDTGSEIVQVVCGAPNARTGMKAVLGRPGDYVPGIDVTLKEAEIRGVKSQGMMCSARELELGEDHDGILDLPADAPVGAAYADYAGLNDPVIDVAITPNRQDCMGVAGIARDLAAAGLGKLITKHYANVQSHGAQAIPIKIVDEDGCPAFVARLVKGVKNGPSPDWLQRKLVAVGQRSISALVDVTNYLSLDRGRPLHVYDVGKLAGGITVRRGCTGEKFTALNDKDYAVDDSMTCITDDSGVLGLGGIIGGVSTGCDENTMDVLIECAFFDPATIGATGRATGLTTDARQRFERGVDPGFMLQAVDMATTLIQEFCGGTASDVSVTGKIPEPSKIVAFRTARVATLGGLDVPPAEQKAILERLGFGVNEATTPWAVRVPSWRRDVDGEADIVEEIIRMAGLDNVPAMALPRLNDVAKPTSTPLQLRTRKSRRQAAARGFHETITWAFVSPAEAGPFGAAWQLENPISTDLAIMRTSLLPGLVSAARRNLDRGQATARLFETGRRYLAAADGFERETLALIGAGEKTAKHWQAGKASSFDVWDAKAEAFALLEAAGAPVDKVQVSADAPGWYHPGRSGQIKMGPKNILAQFGEIHPRTLKLFDVAGPVMAVEIFLDAIPLPKSSSKRARAVYAPSDLQPVSRDFAFVMDAATDVAPLLSAVRGADKELIASVDVFDVFAGKNMEPGQKSVALAVTLQPKKTAFTSEQIDAVAAKIIAAAKKSVGAKLRG
jgi:phenylalanyl-tRNA synthetase beta chain